MPFDFSRFLTSVEARARSLRGLSIASIAWAVGAAVSAIAMLTVRLLRFELSPWLLLPFAALPLLAAIVGYVVGRLRPPRMPFLLLRIDDTLGLDARLSSLYEIRRRPTRSIFRARLEAEVRDGLARWRSALPVDRRTKLGAPTGAVCLALALGLAFVPLPTPAPSPLERLDAPHAVPAAEEQAAPTGTPHSNATAPAEAPPPIGTDPETGAGEDSATLGTPDRDETLDDVMRDLSGLSPDEAVLVPLSPEDLEEMARAQGAAMRAALDLLERIQDRLENTPPSEEPPRLTDEELADLQQQLDQGGLPPDLEQGLNELMEPPPSRTVEEIVEDLIDRFGDEDGNEEETSGRDGRPQSTAMPPDQQSIEDIAEEYGQPPEDAAPGTDGEGAGPDGEAGGDGSGADGTETLGGPSEDAGPREIEDPDPFGGTGGPGGPLEESTERQPGFIREEEAGKIGSEGDFVSEFVTEGVPIEVLTGTDASEPSYRVRFDRIDSILRARGVPGSAIEIVRDYFNAITEGET